MTFLRLEQGKTLFLVDIGIYTIAVLVLTAFLITESLDRHWLETIAFVMLGIMSWTAIEYVLHRFILHSFQPFIRWHAMHHHRPKAFVFAPTVVSASLITTLIFLPALLLSGVWLACAITLGVMIGYLFYTIIHHAIHHWHTDNHWLKERKRCHALHHHYNKLYGCYGVTSAFWDQVFGSNYHPHSLEPKSLNTAKLNSLKIEESNYDPNSIIHH